MKQNALCGNRRPFPTSMWRRNRFAGRCDHLFAPKETVQTIASGWPGLSRGGRMRKNTAHIFCLFFLIISSLSAQNAPWEKTAGPPGLQVTVIYKANGIVYAGTPTQGVYKSTDDGISWVAANSGPS